MSNQDAISRAIYPAVVYHVVKDHVDISERLSADEQYTGYSCLDYSEARRKASYLSANDTEHYYGVSTVPRSK